MGRPAVFLDRDGTVVREVGYLRSVRQLRLLPGAAGAIRRLNEAGFAVVLVSNQSGVARGLLTEAELERIHSELKRRLERQGARLDAVYYCPHHPEAAIPAYRRRCRCRKPAPGMILRAARELGLDLRRSWAVGDSARDIEAGQRAGCRAILVRTGYGASTEERAESEEERREPAWRRRMLGQVQRLARQANQGLAMVTAILREASTVDNLPAAVDWILAQRKRGAGSRCRRR